MKPNKKVYPVSAKSSAELSLKVLEDDTMEFKAVGYLDNLVKMVFSAMVVHENFEYIVKRASSMLTDCRN